MLEYQTRLVARNSFGKVNRPKRNLRENDWFLCDSMVVLKSYCIHPPKEKLKMSLFLYVIPGNTKRKRTNRLVVVVKGSALFLVTC